VAVTAGGHLRREHALVPNVYIEMYIDGAAANMARVLYTKMYAWFARCEFRASPHIGSLNPKLFGPENG
jgi:hypothetical protein